MSFWDSLDSRYRVILCDIWGVVHDGVRLYPNAAERLAQWRCSGRKVILITNAPRTAEAVEQQLAALGLPRSAWDGIATSGEAGIAGLRALGRPVGFLGTADDRAVLESRQVPIAAGPDFADLACSGLEEARPRVEQYRDALEHWARRGVVLHCLNPDRLVVFGGVPEPCAGALADLYEQLGGEVRWYGKPFPAIYRHALQLAGDPPSDAVLAVGDGLQTDLLGAARMGFDAVLVSGGIQRGRPIPADFAAGHGLGGWRPVAVVDGLA
jgi:HAD superfamily hydrolase (TIGR01459 family)